MTDSDATLRDARMAFDARRYGEAAALYESLVKYSPGDPEILLLSARASLLARQFDEALIRSIRAVYRVPDHDAAYEMWADAADALGDGEQAMVAWQALLDRRPQSVEAKRGIARLHRRTQTGDRTLP